MRLVIELKRGGDPPQVVLNQLYKRTQMQTSFGVNMVALVDGVPRTLSLKELIHHYVGHQREVVTRRTQYELRQAEARAHILEGLLIALDNLDAVIALIRGSADPDAARDGPDREVRALRGAGAGDPRHAPAAPHRARVRQGPRRARRADREDRRAARDPRRRGPDRRPDHGGARPRSTERYGDERRTEITFAEGDVDIEDMIADQQMVISITALRLREAAAARDLPPAAPRRRRRDGDEPQGGRLHRAPPHLLDPRLPAVLHQPGQGLPAQGLRAARGRADREGQGAGQRAAAARRRAGDGGDPDARLQGGRSTSPSRPPRGWSRRPSSSPTTRRSAPTGSSRSRSATATSWSRCG